MVLWLPPCIYDRIRHSKPGECIWEPSLNKEFVIIIAALGHHGACVLMLSCYLRVQVFMYKRRAVKASKCHTVTKPNSVVHPTDFDETTNDIDATSFHITNSPLETKSNSSEKYEASNSILHIDTKRTAVDEIKERKRHHHKRERTVFIALTYILIGYAVCWIPFHVVFDVSSVCPSCVPRGVYAVTFWMTYMNSTINPFLYNFSNPEFRNTFKKILYRCKGASLD